MSQAGTAPGSEASSDSLAETLVDSLEAFGETLLILRKSDLGIIWSSPAAELLLSTSAPLLPQLGSDFCTELQQLASRAVINDRTINLVTQDEGGSVAYSCAAVCVDDDRITLRLHEKSGHYLQLQQYMEEREKLFTTSRTISVSEMATTLAHELNQPIGTVSNILKGIKARLLKVDNTGEDIIAALDRANDQTQFAARIISRIRDFTQSRQPNRIDCNIKTLLLESLDLLDWVLAKGEVSASVEDPGMDIIINGDTTMLQQVFTNLIRNAVDSMRENSSSHRHLTLSVLIKDGEVQVSIADTGHGLSATAENNLFVPFVTQKTQGMGVGLNICRSFVELHQGRLWLAQNQEGGCTAFVVLPLVSAG